MTTTAPERVPAPFAGFDYSSDFAPEHTPTFTLDRQLADWRAETPLTRQAQLEADWQAGIRESREAEGERIRVRYGRGSAQFRRASIRLLAPLDALRGGGK